MLVRMTEEAVTLLYAISRGIHGYSPRRSNKCPKLVMLWIRATESTAKDSFCGIFIEPNPQ